MNPAEIPAQSRHNPRLRPAHAPLLQGMLGDPGGALQGQREGNRAALITLAGRRTFAAGTKTHGLRDVWLHAQHVAGNFTTVDFSGGSINDAPGFVQRSNQFLEERVCVPRDLGALVWQWTARAAAQLQLLWTVALPPESIAQPASWNTAERWLLVNLGGKRSPLALYCFNRAVTWELHDHPASISVLATTALLPGESITLVMAAGQTERALEEVSRAFDQLSTLAPARHSITNRIERERVSIHTPIAYLNDEWPRALQSLDTLLVDAPAGLQTPLTGYRPGDSGDALHFKTSHAVFAALTGLSAGDHHTARQLIEFLVTTKNSAGEIAGGGTLTGALEFADHHAARLFLLLVAQDFAWTGDVGLVRRVWVHVRRAVASEQFSRVEAEAAAAVLRELSQTAEAVGERDDGIAFKALADKRAPELAAPPDSAWSTVWGTVDDDELVIGPTELALCTGIIIASVIYGLFGAVPDAARNRIELRPRITRNCDVMELNNLRVGDCRLSLHYRREGSRHSFLLRPLEGALPLRVILEPAIHASGIGRVTVDGQEAVLDVRREGKRWICPIQVVVDHDRTIVIETSDPEGA